MASEPIRSTAITAAPKDYQIPNAQQIRLLSVTAEFIDNGAAGDWLPAVVILDNNGNALCRAVDQGVKVTAGGDAEVSWFPGVNAGGSTGRSVIAWGVLEGIPPNQVIAPDPVNGNPTDVDFTGGSVVEDGSGMFFFDPLNPTYLQARRVTQPGWFVVQGNFSHDDTPASALVVDDVRASLFYAAPVGGGTSPVSGGDTFGANNGTPSFTGGLYEWGVTGVAPVDVASANYGFQLELRNFGGGTGKLQVNQKQISAAFIGAA